jgi:hypothetical protein
MKNIKCAHCGLTNFHSAETCKRCGTALNSFTEEETVLSDSDKFPGTILTNPSNTQNQHTLNSSIQSTLVVLLLALIFALLAWNSIHREVKYEYKVLEFMSTTNDRTGAGASDFASIQVSESQLATLGAEGWELVDSLLEVETAFPNFGNSQYVTGLQPNVRPQRAVLLFKRPL